MKYIFYQVLYKDTSSYISHIYQKTKDDKMQLNKNFIAWRDIRKKSLKDYHQSLVPFVSPFKMYVNRVKNWHTPILKKKRKRKKKFFAAKYFLYGYLVDLEFL